MKDNISASGIICYYDNRKGELFEFEKDILYLCLEARNSEYDFPKGCMDEGEDVIQCAHRETYEEANIDTFDFKEVTSYCIPCGRALCLYIGELKESVLLDDVVKIKQNPVTKIYEHKNYFFVTKSVAINNLADYLIEPLEKADSIIRGKSM